MRLAEETPSRQAAAALPDPLRRLFFESNDRLLARLIAAIGATDLTTALKLAHALKGAALFAGFGALAEAAAETERHLRRRDAGAAAAAIAPARVLLKAVCPTFSRRPEHARDGP